MRLSALAGIAVFLASISSPAGAGETLRMPKAKYLDKCKGAWAGQMIGVCYGAPTEFHYTSQMIPGPLEPWKPQRVNGAIGQDDCYVEMTFLMALEKYGLDITMEQAGKVFGESQYGLAHANRCGRDNIRQGIPAPMSGNPLHNRHADDIDFQIEADLIGIICPAMPQECNRLCDIFGHIMNYGDGVYGGMFVAGMYTAAYIEDKDVMKVVQAGLACIPSESQYHKCISDVVRWYKENPKDWQTAWKKIEARWQDDIDCVPGQAFNIDAKLNGAYIVVGLLYGEGDMLKTMEIATRCGQDSDCNPSSAAGVLACMKGYAALGDDLTGGIPAIENTKFAHTTYSFKTLIPACQATTEKILRRAGGKIEDDAYIIPAQQPKPPAKLEQWSEEEQKKSLAHPISPEEMAGWNPAWKAVACGNYMEPGLFFDALGKHNVLLVHPVSQQKPAILAAELKVPADGKPKLSIEVAAHPRADFLLKVFVNDQAALEKVIKGDDKWLTETVDLVSHAGKTATVRIECHKAGEWDSEAAYFGKVAIVP